VRSAGGARGVVARHRRAADVRPALVTIFVSNLPEASRDSGRVAGLVTVLGFAVAAALSSAS